MNARKITINDIINNTKEQRVFALNATRGSDRAQIIVTVRSGDRTDTVTVPPTWIPIDMTLQTTKEALMASPEFRRALANNLLSLIDADEADSILAQNDAQEEVRRLQAMANLSADVVQLNRSANAEGIVDPAVQELNEQLKGAGIQDKSRAMIRAENIVAQLESNDLTESEALSEIRSMGIEYEVDVLEYLKSQAKQDRRWNAIFKWTRGHLKAM